MILKLKNTDHLIPISNTDINRIVVSNNVSFRKKDLKYFTGYKDGRKVRPLYILLRKMSADRSGFDQTKYMSFLIKDD